jgi:hypothetical protein
MNQTGTGDVTGNFILPDKQMKRSILEQAVEESSKNVSISKREKDELLNYEESVICK